MMRSRMWAVASLALVASVGVVLAQNPGFTRTIVTKGDVSAPNREAVEARVEISPGAVIGWHTHPGEEVGYVTDGETTLLIAGQPPRKVAAGEGFIVPAGIVHSAKNEGNSATKLVVVYIVEKGKPLASPAPAPGH